MKKTEWTSAMTARLRLLMMAKRSMNTILVCRIERTSGYDLGHMRAGFSPLKARLTHIFLTL